MRFMYNSNTGTGYINHNIKSRVKYILGPTLADLFKMIRVKSIVKSESGYRFSKKIILLKEKNIFMI